MHPECNRRKSDSIVPAARRVAREHTLIIARPDGRRRQLKAA
jgi:hypothetical protein